jgi:RimJ/RimL family protein N-acetyltransferase
MLFYRICTRSAWHLASGYGDTLRFSPGAPSVFEAQPPLSPRGHGNSQRTTLLGKRYWGKGLATRALSEFLAHTNPTRPIYARAAKDNIGSLRVLEKCGFRIIGEDRDFANARGKEIEEFLLQLD